MYLCVHASMSILFCFNNNVYLYLSDYERTAELCCVYSLSEIQTQYTNTNKISNIQTKHFTEK